MLTSRNLLRNPGFADLRDGVVADWEADGGDGPVRVATEAFDARRGFPFAAHAALINAGGSLAQTVDLGDGGCFAFRITGRTRAATGAVHFAIGTEDGAPLHAADLPVGRAWSRPRTAFRLPPGRGRARMVMTASGGPVEITDVRLVVLGEAGPAFSIRFEPRGTIDLPSTRLRALMIEDHLNLAGWRVDVGEGTGHDLLVCQKAIRWGQLARTRLAGGAVIFDLDDDEFAGRPLHAAGITLFSRMADGVTAGGTVLAERLSRPSAPAFLLDNPMDVLDPTIVHAHRTWNDRLVWFGMPENGWMVDALDLDRPVTRITRGGDVEYALRTVDVTLADFDLALLPVVLTNYTRAKNANRMVKCVGLGLPFLASDTPEHRRALVRLGLGERFLAKKDWRSAIDAVAADYDGVKDEIDAARARAFATYGVETITAGWLDYCRALLR